jgi:hypothetical protein
MRTEISLESLAGVPAMEPVKSCPICKGESKRIVAVRPTRYQCPACAFQWRSADYCGRCAEPATHVVHAVYGQCDDCRGSENDPA